MNDSTCEPQYNCVLDLKNERGFERMGLMSNYVWHDDPKRLVFLLSRYKFVAKMMSGKSKVLEVGCADGFGTRIVRQEVGSVTAVDFDPLFIDDAKQNCSDKWPIEFHVHDMLEGGFSERSFDGAYAVDVLEHISEEDEDQFIGNIVSSLTNEGVLIFGTPTLESQEYASTASKAGHVNCKTGDTMRAALEPYFHNVIIFSMNDEVIHTGFQKMAHYVWGIASTMRER